MLDVLQFYVSSFWAWLGITIGIAVVGQIVIVLAAIILKAVNRNA